MENDILTTFTDLLNKYGSESKEVKDFIDKYKEYNKTLKKEFQTIIKIRDAFARGIIK